MDIFSHAFWTAVAAKSANSKIKYFKKRRPISPVRSRARVFDTSPSDRGAATSNGVSTVWAALWGVAPDVFAFAPVFISVILAFLSGENSISISNIRHPSDIEPMGEDTLFIFRLTRQLYNIGHSAIIFAAVFAIVAILLKKPKWSMLGWLFHILIDIPTHSYKFYPTPVFWPFSSWEFNGISWATPWFLVLDVSAMLIVSLIYFIRKKKLI